MEETADFAKMSGSGDGRLDGDGKTVEGGAARFLGSLIELAGLGADAVGVEVGEDVELRIQTGELIEISLGQFNDRDCAGTKLIELVDGRGEDDVVH